MHLFNSSKKTVLNFMLLNQLLNICETLSDFKKFQPATF